MFFKKTILPFLLLFVGLSHAYSDEHNRSKNEQSYTNGFGVSIGTHPSIATGLNYYLGHNNQWNIFFAVSPYSATYNYAGYQDDNAWSTIIAAGVHYYIPIAREHLNNRFFFQTGPAWGQTFGKNFVNDANIREGYSLSWAGGFQYRFNNNVYLGFTLGLVTYAQQGYDDTSRTAVATNTKQYYWGFLDNPAAYITWKI